jgi:hypothetical protein
MAGAGRTVFSSLDLVPVPKRLSASAADERGMTVNRRAIVIALWSLIVAAAGFFLGGGQVAPCLGLYEAQRACVAAWEAVHPAPPAFLDTTLPWPWLAIYVLGLIMTLAVGRLRGSRRARSGDINER